MTPDDPQLATLGAFFALFEAAPLPMVQLDRTLRVRRANRAFAELVGLDLSELQGSLLLDWVHPDDVEACTLRHALLLGGDLDHFHERARYLSDARIVRVQGSMFSERDGHGSHRGTLGIIVPDEFATRT